jgi:hypothetical protein
MKKNATEPQKSKIPKKPTGRAEIVPEGWFPRAALQKAWKVGQSQTVMLIQQAMNRGEAEVRMFRVNRPTGIRKVPHYRFKA